MGMCCEKNTMIGWRNVWSMKWRVPGQEVDQRKLGERLWKKTVEHVDWVWRMPWFVVDGESRLGWLMTTMSVSGWMFLLVPAHPGCPGQIPQSRKTVLCVCVCVCVVWRVHHSICDHYTGQPVLVGTPVKNWSILLEQSFTACMPLLMTTSGGFGWVEDVSVLLDSVTCTVSISSQAVYLSCKMPAPGQFALR